MNFKNFFVTFFFISFPLFSCEPEPIPTATVTPVHPLHWPVSASLALQGDYLGLLPAELRLELLKYACGDSLMRIFTHWALLIEQYLPNLPGQDVFLTISDPAVLKGYQHTAFSPQGTHFALATHNKGFFYLWNTATGKLIFKNDENSTYSLIGKIISIAFTQNGKFLVILNEKEYSKKYTVHFFDIDTLTWSQRTILMSNPYTSARLCCDNNGYVFGIGACDKLHILDQNTAKWVKSCPWTSNWSNSNYAVNTNGTLIATGNNLEKKIGIHDAKTGKIKNSLSKEFSPDHIRFIDETTLWVLTNNQATFWDAKNGKIIKQYCLEKPNTDMSKYRFALSPLGTYIYGYMHVESQQTSIDVWDASSGHFLYDLSSFAKGNTSLEFHCSDAFFILYEHHGNIGPKALKYTIFKSDTGKVVIENILEGCMSNLCVCLSCPDCIVISHNSGLLFLNLSSWNPKKNSLDLYTQYSKHSEIINWIYYLPKMNTLLTKTQQGTLRIWKSPRSLVVDYLVEKTTVYQILLLSNAWKAAHKKVPLNLMGQPLYIKAFNQFPPVIKQTLRRQTNFIMNQKELDAYLATIPMPYIPTGIPALTTPEPEQTPAQTGTKRKLEDA